MAAEDLNTAIQLIQQGQAQQAQPILQALIRANPQDLAAWSWYVKSCATPAQRLQALEICLKLNPGNAEVSAAIDKLRAGLANPPLAAAPAISAPAVQPFSSPVANYEQNYHYDEPTPGSRPLAEPVTNLAQSSETLPGLLLPGEPESRPFTWFEIWFRALTQVNAPSYYELLRDPTADPSRVYIWLLIANLFSGVVIFVSIVFLGSGTLYSLIQASSLPGLPTDPGTLNSLLLVLIPLGAVLNVFGSVLVAAIYNLIAKMFGGTGNFARTIYLMGAYTAPLTILTSILSMIPIVVCLTIPLGWYAWWMSICAIQAAHRIPTAARALMVLLIPTIVIFILFCLFSFAASQYFLPLINSQMGTY